MKKVIGLGIVIATVLTFTTSVFASASHSYSSIAHKETCTVSGVLVGEYGYVGVEVWDSTYNLNYSGSTYQRDKSTQSFSYTESVSHSGATKGYYVYTHYDYIGTMIEGAYGWDT